jgi:energy-coupling factor transport system ATP-binding protein
MEKIIRVENIDFSYDKESSFIRNMSFTIEKGSYTCIVGSNGSGKTTISKLLAGLLFSDKGNVFIDGLKINDSNMNEIRKYVGVIFQNPDNQYMSSSLKEDIIFGLENYNVDPKYMNSILDKVSSKCDVSHLLDKDPSSMSGGEKQKGNLASMLSINPKILILDEAYTMLDAHSKKEIGKLIQEMKNSGMTIVSVTHDGEELLLADNIIVLDRGNIVFDGTMKELYKFDCAKFNVDLPNIMKLEKELGYENYVEEEIFISKVGETL